ncbi:MAG: hypothetical protein HYV07_14225 [Deltaproteobacteria bacterium]|nr:hypothetical protein [Deltaproteobacteria bacterium]
MKAEQDMATRAKEPIAQLLIRRLMVPSIYFDASWPDRSTTVDLLAVDRGGTGDVHVVAIRATLQDALVSIPDLQAIPAQYRWIAFASSNREASRRRLTRAALFSDIGPGRVGGICFFPVEDGTTGADIVIPAERFAGSLRKQVDRFVGKHSADIEFRP